MFGIYMIVNKTDGKVYIGSTVQTFYKRFCSHRSELNRGIHKNLHLQRAWNLYGSNNFEFKVVDQLEEKDKERIAEIEQFYLDVFFGENCYNILPNAHSAKGIIRDDNYKKRMSVSVKNAWTEERKQAYSKRMSNKSYSDEEMAILKERTRHITMKTWPGFISPEGKIYSPVEDLVAFAKEHELNPNVLRQVAKQQKFSHKGWKSVDPYPIKKVGRPKGKITC